MSVIIGEKPDQAARQSALQANDDTELGASTPFSVSLWVARGLLLQEDLEPALERMARAWDAAHGEP